MGGTDAGFGYVDTPIRYQDARTHGSEAQAFKVRSLSYLFQHAAGWSVGVENQGFRMVFTWFWVGFGLVFDGFCWFSMVLVGF